MGRRGSRFHYPRDITVRLEVETYEALRELARKEDISVSEIVRRAIAEYLKKVRK